MDADVINKAINEAVEEAKEQGIHGKATTPFLLAKIKDITGGSSLDANIQLVYNNAKLATATACELAKLAKKYNLDAIHDTVHEMARDEARHGKAFEGLLKRYFNK